MLDGVYTQEAYDQIHSRITFSQVAREQLANMLQANETDNQFIQDAVSSSTQLRKDLRDSNKMQRVALTSLYKAQNSTKEFSGEYGDAHRALKNKLKAIKKEDIKS